MYPIIQLKTGREASVGFHHPWVFSGAIERLPADLKPGAFVHVTDRQGEIVGTGTYGVGTIAVRVFDFAHVEITQAWIGQTLQKALMRRRLLGYGPSSVTTGYRLVHGEGDGLPGLVVDVFGDVLVIQISTAGMDALRDWVITELQHLLHPRAIIEKSDMGVREQEHLPEIVKVQTGEVPAQISFLEQGNTYIVDVLRGQKTGFFLDQKDLRNRLPAFAKGRSCLNLFSYTGASTVSLLKAGATRVHNVDESQPALEMIASQVTANDLSSELASVERADIFQWLGQEGRTTYDMILLDPPALAKTKREKESAMKAYHFLNRAAMRLINDGGIFITSSCSHYVSEDDLMFTLRRASVQAGVKLHFLASVRQSADHPWSVYWPEGLYLKSFVFQVEK